MQIYRTKKACVKKSDRDDFTPPDSNPTEDYVEAGILIQKLKLSKNILRKKLGGDSLFIPIKLSLFYKIHKLV